MLHAVAASARPIGDGLQIGAVPRFRLEASERRALTEFLRKRGSGPLHVPIRVQATGAQAVDLQLELIPESNIQEGLIVLDLGTSTSVACQYDPSFVERTVFPREQLAQLRKDFAEFLGAPGREILEEAESHWFALLQAVCKLCGLRPDGDPARALMSCLKFAINSDSGAEGFYDLLRHFELQLWSLNAPLHGDELQKFRRFQERIAAKLHTFYGRAFEKMPLGQWNIRLCRPEGETADYVVSETRIEGPRAAARRGC